MTAAAATIDNVPVPSPGHDGGRGWPGVDCPVNPVTPAVAANRRLVVAMAVATALLSIVLVLDIDLVPGRANSSGQDDGRLSVRLLPPRVERRAETGQDGADTFDNKEAAAVSGRPGPSTAAVKTPADDAAAPEPPPVSVPARQWQALARRVARDNVGQQSERERVRAANWREARSSMFRPGEGGVTFEEEPLLADLRFRQPAGVLGIGLTFGSCFVGIPVAGIPVEERSVGITLFYCRGDAD